MPCAYDYHYEDQKELQLVTRAACDLAKVLREGGRWADLAPETKSWALKHDAEDAMQKEAERAYDEAAARGRQVIEQLTVEQRRILGLG